MGTAFVRKNFDYHGGYLMYRTSTEERPIFIARFKYNKILGSKKSKKAVFLNCLIKNFTVEEYTALLAERKAPMDIIRTRGFDEMI